MKKIQIFGLLRIWNTSIYTLIQITDTSFLILSKKLFPRIRQLFCVYIQYIRVYINVNRNLFLKPHKRATDAVNNNYIPEMELNAWPVDELCKSRAHFMKLTIR